MADIIQSLCNYIKNTNEAHLDIASFIEKYYPHLLVNCAFADFVYSNISEVKKADAIISAFKAKKEAEYNRSHKKGFLPDYYALYCSFANPTNRLTCKEYYDYFSDYCGMPLSGSEYNLNTKVNKAIQSLTSIGESSDNILLFLDNLWNDSTYSFIPNSENPLAYSDSEFEHIRKSIYSDAKKLLMPIKNNMLDAICATITDMNENDIPLENIPVLQLFSNTVKNQISIIEPILIIEPSPFFIKKLRGNNPFRRRKVIFVLQDNILVEIYTKLFKVSDFSFIQANNLSTVIASVDLYPTNVLLFGTHIRDTSLKTEYIRFCLSCVNNMHYLCILDSDYYIQHKSSPIKSALSKANINNIWLFPSGISHATKPEMKVLLQCTYGYVQQSSNKITLTRYTLTSNKKDQYLSPNYYQAQLSSDDFFSSDLKLRSIYRANFLESQTKSSMIRNTAESFTYSSELSVYYTISGEGNFKHPYRVAAYVREPQIGNSKSPIILNSKKSTKKISPNEIENWIENTYLRSNSIRSAISNIYQKYYQNKPVTLRSFIFFNYEWEKTLPHNALNDLYFINHSLLGDIPIDNISFEDISQILYADSHYVRIRMMLLSNLFDLAIKQGYCKNNPIKNELRSTQNEHEFFYQVRSNLTLKNLNEQHFIYAINVLLKKCQKGNLIALASTVCILTGLDANIVCALKWKDFSTIHISGNIKCTISQLCIQRQSCNDGTEIKPFVRHEQYRKLPCPSILSNLLSEEYKKTKTIHSGMPQEYIDNSYIFIDTSTNNLPLSPIKLRKANRELIKKINIPAEIIPIPDNKKGTLDTNLAYYPYDLFRTNFDYYARHVGKFELGEIEYYLGIQPSTTFSRYYCDYTNDYSQLILYTKLERIIKRLISEDNFHAKQENKNITDTCSIVSSTDSHNLSFIGIDLAVTENSNISITVDTKYGHRIYVQETEVSNDN